MGTIELSGAASVLVLGVSLLLAVRVLALSGERSPAAEQILRQTAYILLAVGATSACTLTGDWLGYFVAWPVVMAVWARAAINFRATQKRNLFGALAIAIDNNMPLGPVALAFANEQEGSFAGRARALGDALTRGVALEKAWPESSQALPREMPMAAALGRESGDLSAALDATTYANRFDRSWLQPAISRMLYLLALLMVFNATVLYLQARIAPSYAAIFNSYNLRLPNSTLAAVSQLPHPDVRWQAPIPCCGCPSSRPTGWRLTLRRHSLPSRSSLVGRPS